MKQKTSKTQLAFLSILAGIVYLFIITADLVNGWKDGIIAFREGMQKAEIENKMEKTHSWESFGLSIEPKNFDYFYSDSLQNLKTGVPLPVSYEKIQVRYTHVNSQTTKMFLLETGMLFTAIPTIILYILIFILFYKLIVSFYNDKIFWNKNVRRMKFLGVLYITLYFLQLAFYLMYYFTTTSLIELSDYKIKMPNLGHEILLIGIILLIATNVMKRAIVLKEEHELTI